MSEAGTRTGRVGVREVAQLAGVSSQTVSRVINEHPSIRPETRRRVLEAMAALGYRVNNAARALGTRTTRTLGVIASDATLYGPSVGIAALEAAAREAGRWVATAYADAADEASVDDAAERLLAQGVDGIVVLAPHARSLESLAGRSLGVPLSALHGGPGTDAQEEGVGLVVAHLATLGHTRVALLAGPADWLEAAARARGFERAVQAHGLVEVRRWEGDWTAQTASTLGPGIAADVRAVDGPTAILAANDQMALGLIAGLREQGIQVPRDVSIAGFDDNPDAAFYRPSLTTVHLDLAGEARRCVAEVLQLAEPTPPTPPALIVRASTSAPSGPRRKPD
ncbi:LacI family DNA-binding transcriptional regulator [Microbacterium sp. SS28]|uniref:LacI family DNA-binding transcriptional regulator n=1 Tax=Microbacterium sp. SS28 TaxID=2919948 RepID=UPI001FAB1BA9|nr:LacI family DNA-binding transcriptional regulator [Microbacterium sp. SS28]